MVVGQRAVREDRLPGVGLHFGPGSASNWARRYAVRPVAVSSRRSSSSRSRLVGVPGRGRARPQDAQRRSGSSANPVGAAPLPRGCRGCRPRDIDVHRPPRPPPAPRTVAHPDPGGAAKGRPYGSSQSARAGGRSASGRIVLDRGGRVRQHRREKRQVRLARRETLGHRQIAFHGQFTVAGGVPQRRPDQTARERVTQPVEGGLDGGQRALVEPDLRVGQVGVVEQHSGASGRSTGCGAR